MKNSAGTNGLSSYKNQILPNFQPVFARAMPTSARRMLRKQLYTLGVIPPSRLECQKLKELLEKRVSYVNACENAMMGSIWSIIVESDGFWEDARDFLFICMLCRVCKIFSYALQSHVKAWTAISKNHSYMSDRMLGYIFRVPLKYLPRNYSIYTETGQLSFMSKVCPVKPVQALNMSYIVNNGACGFFAKRTIGSSAYHGEKSKGTMQWSKEVRDERIWPYFVDFLLSLIQVFSSQSLGKDAASLDTLTVTHTGLCEFIQRQKKTHDSSLTNRDITDFMILCQLHCKDYMEKTPKKGDALIQYVWEEKRLFWRIMPREVILFRYPYAGHGIMRKFDREKLPRSFIV